MKVTIDLSPKQVEMCQVWGEMWALNDSGDDYANSILTKVAREVMSYDRIYLEAISG